MTTVSPKQRILIVGHGIGGALVAWYCFKAGVEFTVVDEERFSTSSKVSSGLINPVTGRYFAKSWRVDEFMPLAEKIYEEIGHELGKIFMKRTEICRQLYSIAQENEWTSRMNQDRFSDYLSTWDAPPPLPLREEGVNAGKIRPVLQINSLDLIGELWQKWKMLGIALPESFDHTALRSEDKLWYYRGEHYSQVIFSEGVQVLNNPFFQWLPIEPTKGEVIFASIAAPQAKAILKHHCFVIPWEDGKYWVGSNYEKYPQNDEVDLKKQGDLEDKLARSIDAEYTVLERKSGIRPACKDRRPVIGEHPRHAGLFVLNGLGTKGTLLAPFLAQSLVDHILEGRSIDDEVDVRRWYPLYRSE